jgi:eukaryotic-like serine/threonine-protein kinase
MAVVHIGRLLGPIGFSRTVALKRMLPHYAADPGFVSMFVDEARLASRIRHPNVVPTLDVVANDGELFLVMEYVHGETLSQLIKTCSIAGKRLPISFAASIVCSVLQGLHAAHHVKDERGRPLELVHRDVSPQNVLVGTDGVARLLDFGVAKAVGRLQTTVAGQLKGKLAYMAPEQVRGSVSAQSDIYAASAVLWEALTCQRLFHNTDWNNIAQTILQRKVAPPSTHAPEIPPELDAIVLRGLEKDPARRFRSAREMAFAIQKCVEIASPLEIGDWVEVTAGAVLAQRARKIAEIESHSAGTGVPYANAHDDDSLSTIRIADGPWRRAAREADTLADAARPSDSHVATTLPEIGADSLLEIAHSPAVELALRAKNHRGKLSAIAAAALCLAIGLAALSRRIPAPHHSASSEGPSHVSAAAPPGPAVAALVPAAPVVSTPISPPASQNPPSTPAASGAALNPPAAAAGSAQPFIDTATLPAASESAEPIARPHPRAPVAPRAKHAIASPCNPPYTIDLKGIRHIKPECL